MPDRRARLAIAVVGPFLLIGLAAWWADNVRDLQRHASATFDIGWSAWAVTLDYVIAVGGAFTVFWFLTSARSRLLAVGYVLVGGLLAFDAALIWTFGASINGAPPVAPEPVATLLNEIYVRLEFGPGVGPQVIGAGMLLAGLVDIARSRLGARLSSRGWGAGTDPTAR